VCHFNFHSIHRLRKNSCLKATSLLEILHGKGGNAEVDYVVNSAQQIIPIEVKSGKSGRLRSLLSFAQRGQPKLLLRFDTNLPSLQKITLDESPSQRKGRRPEVDLLSLPLYAAGFFSRSISG
jgi:uncharacterized protein